jgi:hypothetical protein
MADNRVIEEWRPVKRSDGRYEVSNLGRVRAMRDRWGRPVERVLARRLDDKGYWRSTLRIGDQYRASTLYPLMLEAFVGPRPDGCEASHINGNSQDDRLENLCWETHAENVARQRAHGTIMFGRKNSQAKLTDADVIEIRRARQSGEYLQSIADRYGISDSNVSLICVGGGWPEVPEPKP